MVFIQGLVMVFALKVNILKYAVTCFFIYLVCKYIWQIMGHFKCKSFQLAMFTYLEYKAYR